VLDVKTIPEYRQKGYKTTPGGLRYLLLEKGDVVSPLEEEWEPDCE